MLLIAYNYCILIPTFILFIYLYPLDIVQAADVPVWHRQYHHKTACSQFISDSRCRESYDNGDTKACEVHQCIQELTHRSCLNYYHDCIKKPREIKNKNCQLFVQCTYDSEKWGEQVKQVCKGESESLKLKDICKIATFTSPDNKIYHTVEKEQWPDRYMGK